MRTLFAFALLGVAGCSGSEPDIAAARRLSDADKPDAAAIVQAGNQAACDLYHQFARSDGNLVFSPFSITTALAMLDAGAAGTTDGELRVALHAEALGNRLHTGYRAVLRSLDVGRDFGAYQLAAADRLFGQTGFPFRSEFLTTTRDDYGAELQPVDFIASPEAARSTVNRWVSDRTAKAIPDLFPAGSIDDGTRLVLANAIFFQGAWRQAFTGATRDEPFRRADGTSITVPMMHKTDDVSIANISDVGTAVELPFRGHDLSLIALVPIDPGNLSAIEAQLSAGAIADWVAALRPEQAVPVAFPRFTTRSTINLHDALTALGIVSAFDPLAANLSGIDGRRDLVVGKALHQAMIQVDEHGATAAAATGVSIGTTSAPAPIVVDRPFIFLLYDRVTGAVLFAGRIVDPTRG